MIYIETSSPLFSTFPSCMIQVIWLFLTAALHVLQGYKLESKIKKRHVQPQLHAGRFASLIKRNVPYLAASYHEQSTPLNDMQDQGDSFPMQYNQVMKMNK